MMWLTILHSIANKFNTADAFTIIADECTNSSNHEQLVIGFFWVESDLVVHEEFVDLYQLADVFTETIMQALRDCLV